MKILLLTFLLFFGACGSDTEDLIELAVESANASLTVGDCQGAMNELEELGRQNKHAGYLKTLASAYACRAGYSTQTFYGTDASKVGTPSVLGGFASFSTSSSNDDPQNQQYLDIQEALNILLYAGDISTSLDPTMTRRALVFGVNDAGDINAMIMYLSMVQLGKYLYFYGNSDALGEKGAGVATNGCLANYKDFVLAGVGNLNTILNGLAVGNSCKGNAGTIDGSNYLGTTLGDLNASRMCEGVVLFNNFFHVFPTVISAIGGGSLGSIGTMTAAITLLKNSMLIAHPPVIEISSVQSQIKCEALAAVDGDSKNLEVFFTSLLEGLFD